MKPTGAEAIHRPYEDRPKADVIEAIRFVEQEIVKNPMAKGADGSPALLQYTVIRDALYEVLTRRNRDQAGVVDPSTVLQSVSDEELLEDASELGEDEDDMAEVIENVEEEEH